MKILMIMPNEDSYGAAKSTIKLVELLKKRHNVNTVVITPHKNKINSICNQLSIENYTIIHYSYFYDHKKLLTVGIPKLILSKFFDLTFYKKIKKLINFDEIDLIHTSGTNLSHGFELSKRYSKPHVWHLRDLWLYKDSFTKSQIREMAESKTEFIAISNIVKKYWESVGLNPSRVTRVYNGVDEKTVEFISKNIKESNEKLKIVVVGRLDPEKQPEVAIKAISLLKPEIKENIILDFYGDTYVLNKKFNKSLVMLVSDLGLDKVVGFKGYSSNIGIELSNYDLGLINSKEEPFGRTTVEYMLAGLGVIASNTGANVEIIEESTTGMFYKSGNATDLANKITNLFFNRQQIIEMGKNARQSALSRFSAQQNANDVFKIYQSTRRNFND